MTKQDWVKSDPAQVTLLVNMSNWARNVEGAYSNLKANPKAMEKALED